MVQTHISVVFLAGERAYKVKKPVDLGFLDFTTLKLRRIDCEEEVRLNRRLAPSVYLGVVPIVRRRGGLKVGGDGPAIEYAVEMRRLPDEATLRSRLGRGKLEPGLLGTLARRLADFHQRAASGPEVARWARFEVVAGNARENFDQTRPFRGQTMSEAVWNRLRDLTEAELSRHRGLIDARARPGVARDTHGDLHLDHVYAFPGRTPPDDLVIVDCIEFNVRLRYADPVSDLAFLAMDLLFHHRSDLSEVLVDAYFDAANDDAGRPLLPYYTAYRAVVRGKVESLALGASEIPAGQRWQDLQRARAHFLLALGELADPGERPCLVLAAGLPGTGKSHLAAGLAGAAGFEVVRSDEVRKELAGVAPEESAAAAVDRGIYSPEWTERTYAVCLERAEELLFRGRRVVVDAGFREEARRREYLAAARAWGVPARILVCEAPAEEIFRRLGERGESRRHHQEGGTRGSHLQEGGTPMGVGAGLDVSDADWAVYQALAGRWEPSSAETAAVLDRIDTSGPPEASLAQALAVLRAAHLA